MKLSFDGPGGTQVKGEAKIELSGVEGLECDIPKDGNDFTCYVLAAPGDTIIVVFAMSLPPNVEEYVDIIVDGILRSTTPIKKGGGKTGVHKTHFEKVLYYRYQNGAKKGLKFGEMIVRDREMKKDYPPGTSNLPAPVSTIELQFWRKYPEDLDDVVDAADGSTQPVKAFTSPPKAPYVEQCPRYQELNGGVPDKRTIPSLEIGFTGGSKCVKPTRDRINEDRPGFIRLGTSTFILASTRDLHSLGYMHVPVKSSPPDPLPSAQEDGQDDLGSEQAPVTSKANKTVVPTYVEESDDASDEEDESNEPPKAQKQLKSTTSTKTRTKAISDTTMPTIANAKPAAQSSVLVGVKQKPKAVTATSTAGKLKPKTVPGSGKSKKAETPHQDSNGDLELSSKPKDAATTSTRADTVMRDHPEFCNQVRAPASAIASPSIASSAKSSTQSREADDAPSSEGSEANATVKNKQTKLVDTSKPKPAKKSDKSESNISTQLKDPGDQEEVNNSKQLKPTGTTGAEKTKVPATPKAKSTKLQDKSEAPDLGQPGPGVPETENNRPNKPVVEIQAKSGMVNNVAERRSARKTATVLHGMAGGPANEVWRERGPTEDTESQPKTPSLSGVAPSSMKGGEASKQTGANKGHTEKPAQALDSALVSNATLPPSQQSTDSYNSTQDKPIAPIVDSEVEAVLKKQDTSPSPAPKAKQRTRLPDHAPARPIAPKPGKPGKPVKSKSSTAPHDLSFVSTAPTEIADSQYADRLFGGSSSTKGTPNTAQGSFAGPNLGLSGPRSSSDLTPKSQTPPLVAYSPNAAVGLGLHSVNGADAGYPGHSYAGQFGTPYPGNLISQAQDQAMSSQASIPTLGSKAFPNPVFGANTLDQAYYHVLSYDNKETSKPSGTAEKRKADGITGKSADDASPRKYSACPAIRDSPSIERKKSEVQARIAAAQREKQRLKEAHQVALVIQEENEKVLELERMAQEIERDNEELKAKIDAIYNS